MRRSSPLRDYLFDHALEVALIAAAVAGILEMVTIGPAMFGVPLWAWAIAPGAAGVATFAALRRL